MALSDSTGTAGSGPAGGAHLKSSPVSPLTTLDATVVLGPQPVPQLPYRRLSLGPALATQVREELCERTSSADTQRTGLAAFGHLTDSHVLDAANPGRLSFFWQYFDFTDGFPPSGLFRPQDLLTVHVLDATIRRLNAVGRGPLSQRPLDCLVTTGDLTNAFALSELSAAAGVFKGVPATSHPTDRYEGVQDHGPAPLELSRHIWHPEPEPSLAPRDDWKAVHGYPTVPGLLEAAIRPVNAEGSDFPWYVGVGNHDEAGRSGGDPVSAKTDFVDTLRIGDRLPMRLPPGIDELDFWETVEDSSANERRTLMASMPSRQVQASKLRREFSTADFMESIAGNGRRDGGASGLRQSPDGQPYYTFDISPQVLGVMLNTASPDGGAKAVLDAAQAAWLEEQLEGVSGRSYDPEGNPSARDVDDRLVVLFSHHPLPYFDEDTRSPGSGEPPLDRAAVLQLISRFPNVVVWLNGHTHRHQVTPHTPEFDRGGFWEITTASLIDYPQQSRVVELLDNGDGTLSIAATLVDHSAPESVVHDGIHTPASMAALSLELVLNRPGLDLAEVMGSAGDQNVDLVLRKPF
ncbi:TIGR03767 family metallophosphoesterase [Arthrobacter sp. UYEF36]|uniref:TIGR03767 family metallophosphoesterase n=1 Tax=Arthrobacter sp. UYEF36 TaxID=1756366 RepID=UPI00339A8C5C